MTETANFHSMTFFFRDNPDKIDSEEGFSQCTFMMDLMQLHKLGKIELDLSGHFLSNAPDSKTYYVNRGGDEGAGFIARLSCPHTKIDIQEAARVIEACVEGRTTDPIEFYASRFSQCGECGERLMFSFDGKNFKVVNECPKPNGCLPYSFDIEVPSGKLYVANDLRRAWPELDCREAEPPDDGKCRDINSRIGCVNTTLDYAAAGMAHVFVGNSCPSVYKTGDGFLIGCSGYDDDDNEIPIPGVLEQVASICTDLWWYCIVDESELLGRFLKNVEFEGTFEKWVKAHNCDIIDVEPGTYRFEVLPYDSEAWREPTIYTRIRRVG